MFDINGAEFLVIALIAVILVGPERLPEYVRGLRGAVKRVRAMVRDGQSAIKEEWGDDVDWTTLDPRQYDPRRIVREALFDDEDATGTPSGVQASGVTGVAAAPASRRGRRPTAGASDALADAAPAAHAPFDRDAT